MDVDEVLDWEEDPQVPQYAPTSEDIQVAELAADTPQDDFVDDEDAVSLGPDEDDLDYYQNGATPTADEPCQEPNGAHAEQDERDNYHRRRSLSPQRSRRRSTSSRGRPPSTQSPVISKIAGLPAKPSMAAVGYRVPPSHPDLMSATAMAASRGLSKGRAPPAGPSSSRGQHSPVVESLPDGWETTVSSSGKTFYHEVRTGKTQWDRPIVPRITRTPSPPPSRPLGYADRHYRPSEAVPVLPPTGPAPRVPKRPYGAMDSYRPDNTTVRRRSPSPGRPDIRAPRAPRPVVPHPPANSDRPNFARRPSPSQRHYTDERTLPPQDTRRPRYSDLPPPPTGAADRPRRNSFDMSRGRRDQSPPRLDSLPSRRPRSPFHNHDSAPEAPPARRASRFGAPVSPAVEHRPLAPTAPALPPSSPVQVRRPSISSTSDSTPHNGTTTSPTAPYKRKRAALPPQGERFVTALEEKAAKDKAVREREDREKQERQQRETELKEREQKEREQKELEHQQQEQQERERREREAATAPSSPHLAVTDQAPVDGIPTGPRRTRRTGERDRPRDRPDDPATSAATSSTPRGPRAMQTTGRRTPPPLAPAAMSRGRGPPEGPSSSRAPKMTGSNSTPVGPRRATSSITPQDESSRSPAIPDDRIVETVAVRNDRRPRPASPDRRYRPAQADRYRPEFEPRPAYRNSYRAMNEHDRSYRPDERSYQSAADYKPAPEVDHGYKKVSPNSNLEKATLPPPSPVAQPKETDTQMALDDEVVHIPPPVASVSSERQRTTINVEESQNVPGTRSLLDRVSGKRVRDDDGSPYGGPSNSPGYDAANKRRRRGGKPRPDRGPREVSGSNSIPVVQRAL